jgi:GNAT superfamily N-acetyltransferase
MPQSTHVSPERSSGSSVIETPPPEQTLPKSLPPELGDLFDKVRRNSQDYGWNVTIQKALAYLLRAVYFRQAYRIYRIDLANAAPPADWSIYHFQFKMLSPQDTDEIAQIEEIAEWMRGRLHESIAVGQPCLVAMDGRRVAGFNLIRMDRATLVLVNLTRKLRPGCAWSEHIAVQREYRRSGLGAQLRLRIFQELKRRGIRRLYGGTLVTNAASLSLARSVGFKEIADVHYRKILSVEKWRYQRVRG